MLVPGAGLEPARDKVSRDFKSLASTNSAIPALLQEAAPGFEPRIRVLQTHALPLGYAANRAGNGIRTRDPDLGKVVLYQLSYSRIAFLIYSSKFVCQAILLRRIACKCQSHLSTINNLH